MSARLADLASLARPRQWTKNAVVFAGLVFARYLDDRRRLGLAALTALAFCLASSATYALNDVCDRAEDRAHPSKRTRPVAAGRLDAGTALGAALVLAAAALALCPAPARAVLGCFLALNLLYSLGLKRVAILDVMLIAFGFVLRVEAGLEAIAAPESAWIVLCMFFVALFLGCGKRRAELADLPATGRQERRAVLGAYSLGFLDVLLALSATTAVVCYALYAVTVQANETFLLTVLPVVFAIARYLMLVLVHARGQDPDDLLTRDPALVAAIGAWAGLCIAVLYGDLRLVPGGRG
ncbi:MAG TPA: UbiA family prenyltransferase [Candidatus Limnocylindria bacterium]|nr:UbiA family prenyltransferase [Candidatus Limnocylindria bacterium]